MPEAGEILPEHSINMWSVKQEKKKKKKEKSSFYLNKLHNPALQTMQLPSEPARRGPESEDLICDDFSNEKYLLSAMNMERFLFPVQQCKSSQIICHSC